MNEQEFDARRTWAAIRRAKRAVLTVGIAGLACGTGLAVARPGPDQATALVLLPGVLSQTPGSTTPDVQTQVVLAQSTPVLAHALDETHVRMSTQTLGKHLQVTSSSPELIRVTVEARRGPQAERLANAVASSYVDYVTSTGTGSNSAGLASQASQLTTQLDSIHNEIARLSATLRSTSVSASTREQDTAALASLENERASLSLQIDALNSQIAQARLNTILAAGSVRVLQQAATYVDTGPTRMALFGGAGFVLGLVIGASGAILRAGRRRRLYSRAELAAAVGLPVVASIGVGHVRRVGDWQRLLERAPSPVDAWNVRRVLHLLEADAAGPSEVRAHVLSLDGDRAAGALAALLAADAARRGVPTVLSHGGSAVPNGFRAACATPYRPLRPPALTLVAPDADLPAARLTVVGLTVASSEPGGATVLRSGRALIGVTAGFATSDDLARLALAATDEGLELLGVIVVNPDDRDATIGEALRPRRPAPPAQLDTTWSAEPVAPDGEGPMLVDTPRRTP